MNRKQMESLHNAGELVRVIAEKIDALPPAQRARHLDFLTDLEADYRQWRAAVQRGRRTLADRQAELRVGVELARRTPPGWVSIR